MADFNPDSLLTSPPPASASMKVTPVMRQILDHIAGPESGGRYDVIYGGRKFDIGGDHPRIAVPIESGPNAGRTSSAAGRYQFIGSTWDAVADKTGRRDMSPESQDINAARLAKDTYRQETGRDIEKDWASGDPGLRIGINRALGTQWEGLAAGPRVSNLDARGRPRFGFSDYARREYEGRPDTDILEMSPADYLDLSPPLEGKPFQNPSGRSLMKSFQRGESIESIPTLNVNVDGTTATVTDQDGRHRALLAKQEGIPSIPVAVQRTGDGKPTEIVGMNGNKRPIEHYQEPQPQLPKAPISLMGQIGQAIMPNAEAAQPDDGVSEEAPPWAVQAKNPPDDGVSEEPPPWAAQQAQEPTKPGERLLADVGKGAQLADAMIQGVGKGVGNTMFGGEELLGKGMQAIGIPGGQSLTEDARARMAAEQAKIAPVEAVNPFGAGVGEFAGGMAGPGGAAMGLARNALARGALSGALSGLLQPGDKKDYWGSKALQAGMGAGVGALTGMAGNALSGIASGSLDPAKRLLVREGVQLTPGQLQGGQAKRAEDTMASWPFVGGVIRAAQRRSFETFNQAAINRALDDIGQRLPQGIVSGFNAISHARDMFRNAYNSVIPNMSAKIDTAFQRGLNGIYLKAQQNNLGQRYLDELQHVIKREIGDPFKLGYGNIDGASFQKIGSQLDMIINRWKQSEDTYYRDMAGYLREADNHLDDMMRRQNPQLQAAKDKIDEGYSKFKTVEHATGKPGSLHEDSGTDGTFTPAQLARSIATRDRSKDKAAYHRGDAMMQDLSRAAQVVLPHKVPDSGTPERLALMGLLTGGLPFEPHTVLGAAALAAPYTAPASRAMNWATNRLSQMAGPRRQAIQGVGNALGSLGAVAAGSGASGAVDPQRTPQ